MRLYVKLNKNNNEVEAFSTSKIAGAKEFILTKTVFDKIIKDNYDIKIEDNKVSVYKGEKYKKHHASPVKETKTEKAPKEILGLPEDKAKKIIKREKILEIAPMHKQLNTLAETLNNIGQAVVEKKPVDEKQLQDAKNLFAEIQKIRNS